jgi:hypothetical protein
LNARFSSTAKIEEFPPLPPEELEPVLAEIAALRSHLIVHAEDAEAIDRAPAAAGSSGSTPATSARPGPDHHRGGCGLLRVRLGRACVVDPVRLQHRHPVTPYRGRALLGQVRETWLRGELVDLDVPRGELLVRRE